MIINKIWPIMFLLPLVVMSGCTEKPIGGETDEHGCLIAAGYQWCPSTGKCQRMWEEYCEEYKEQFNSENINTFEECVDAGLPVMESYPRQCRTPDGRTFVEVIDDQLPIGGETDQNGCLIAAGYSWNQTVGACLREWELTEDQIEAARIAVAPLSYPVTVTQVDVARCLGCFVVHLQKNDGSYQRLTVTLANWEITDTSISMTPEECTDQGGRLVNTVGGETCSEDETNIGVVHGFISPNICCLPIREEEFCGFSTEGSCESDSDCMSGGCSNQVCQSRNEEPVVTTCEFRDCYSASAYGLSCRCVNNKCMWS
jgi:eight-cysteine-cluster-containing protein